MAYQQQERKKPRAPFDMFSLTLWAPSPTAKDKNASMTWAVTQDGKVTITTRTGNPDDKELTKSGDGDTIRITLPQPDYQTFCLLFEEAARSRGPYKKAVRLLQQFGFKDGQRVKLDQPRSDADLIVGKDADGIIFLSLVKYKRPNIVFGFIPEKGREAIHIIADNGQPVSDAELSVLRARGFLATIKDVYHIVRESDIVHSLYAGDYEERYNPKKAFAEKANGGQRSQNHSAPARAAEVEYADADDDIPY